MPRQNRHIEPDTIYHVTSRGVERRPIFLSDADKQYFLSTTIRALRTFDCSLLAFCLMDNHFHYLIATRTAGLAAPMHMALTRYAVRFNSHNERVGHLFQARYYSRPCLDLVYLHRAIAYIHFNPVRAKLVREPGDWSWSSHADWIQLIGTTIDFARLSEITDISAKEFRDSYIEAIASITSGQPRGLSIAALIREACAVAGITEHDLLDGRKGTAYTAAKRILIEAAISEGYPLRELAKSLKCTLSALYLIRKRRI